MRHFVQCMGRGFLHQPASVMGELLSLLLLTTPIRCLSVLNPFRLHPCLSIVIADVLLLGHALHCCNMAQDCCC